MLRDESSCDGGSIVEKLESFVQGTYPWLNIILLTVLNFATAVSLTSRPFLSTTIHKLLQEFAAII